MGSLILISGCISQSQEQESITEYAEEKGISQEIIDSLEVLERDGKLDENEKEFIDTLAGLSEELQMAVIDSSILVDETIDDQELTFLSTSLEMEGLTFMIFESNMVQYTIDAELVERLEAIISWAEKGEDYKEGIKRELKSYYPVPESPLKKPIENAITIHENAWEMVVNNAEEDQYYKYGIYVSRMLAVKHPEVYLQSDGLFVTIITTNKGFKKAYETKDVHDVYFYGRTFETPPFSFDDVDFSSYEIIKSKEYYPEGYPVLPFLDRRLLPIASTLKSAENQLTQLEMGVQMYFATKEENEEMYLIYCDNENTYLSTGEDILSMKTLESAERIDRNPILIFNDQYVWYPLMERDDTDKNETLKELIIYYATELRS
ncbi:MAG TPA: hypothetical protein ENI51_05970 [Candidatus Atribacteria bacterium]|nr:hypothetical protein [Candidatus Atribacteria bacterium]